jgi:FMN phosphatase YigB (HAD superfamily)
VVVLVDLDNTLVDRDLAFRTWAQQFIEDIGADPEDLPWLVAADGDGYTPRADVAVALKELWGLDVSVPDLVHRLLFQHVQFIQTYPGSRLSWKLSRRRASPSWSSPMEPSPSRT